jgi:hypothetical protein
VCWILTRQKRKQHLFVWKKLKITTTNRNYNQFSIPWNRQYYTIDYSVRSQYQDMRTSGKSSGSFRDIQFSWVNESTLQPSINIGIDFLRSNQLYNIGGLYKSKNILCHYHKSSVAFKNLIFFSSCLNPWTNLVKVYHYIKEIIRTKRKSSAGSKYVAMKMKFFSGFPKHFLSKTFFTEYWIDYSFDLLSLLTETKVHNGYTTHSKFDSTVKSDGSLLIG